VKLLVATHNQGKLAEYRRLLADLPFEWLTLSDVGVETEVDETGTTFEQNAELKAEQYSQMTGLLTLADDSGLEVDALDGRPGVYSARYGGPGLDDAGRRQYLLKELEGIPFEQRTARFICVIALHIPQKRATRLVAGTCDGHVTLEEHDAGEGFGYDAIFQPEGYSQTFGELTSDIKHTISHRARATANLPQLFKGVI
jgi:XTP/dITP diphosphohydrolase